VYTHCHWDHVFGASTLDLPVLAHEETRRIVTRMAAFDWSDAALDRRVADGTEIAFCRDMIKDEMPDRGDLALRPPDAAFASETEIDLGGLTVRVIHVGGDHAPDSSIVHVPDEGVVFLGDCFYRDLHHGPDRYTTPTLFPLLDRLLALDADHYVPSHHDEPLTGAQFAAEASRLKTIGAAVDEHGSDREAALAAVAGAVGSTLDADHVELVDAFMAGLRLPVVESAL